MKNNKGTTKNKKITTLEGLMTYGEMDDERKMLDFVSTEYAEVEPFAGLFKVQAMRDGNVYISETPRRKRKKPLLRENNCSLSLGKDGRYYFVFTMDEARLEELPTELVKQVRIMAKKINVTLINRKDK